MSLEQLFDESDNPLSAEEQSLLLARVIAAAKQHLVGRRFVDLFGPLGPGVDALRIDRGPSTDRASLDLGFSDESEPLHRATLAPTAIPIIYRDFLIHWRDLAAAHDHAIPLDFSVAEQAAIACAQREDALLFYGDASLGIPGLLSIPNRFQTTLGDWQQSGEGLAAVVRAAEVLRQENPLPYALLLSPRLFSLLHRVVEASGTLEIDAIRSLVQGGVYVSSQLTADAAALVAPGAQNFDLAVSLDLNVAYLGPDQMEHPFRVLEAVLPRIKRPQAICTFDGA
ncbi:MAG: bacteriocin family protein [Myxococcales bacterium]|jgi:uncharacterized linocin/CFP29 family protein|nr:bacteriocin family protein [Myxococcales bacterium]